MLQIYQNTKSGVLRTCSGIEHNSLLLLECPSNEEVRYVAQKLDLPLNFFEDALDKDELPRIEKADGATMIIVSAPMACEAHEGKGLPYKTATIGVIHAQDHLVIVSREKLPFLQALIQGKYGQFQSYMKTRISLLLFKAVAQEYTHSLASINQRVSQLQQKIKHSCRNTELFGLIDLNKSLVHFSTALSSMTILYRRLMDGHDIKIHDEEKSRLDDILIEIEQSAEVTEMRRESLSNLMDAYAAIIHNNLNGILKLLTALTIIMVIPTMIGSIFSMNVALPHEEEWISTVVIGAGMLLISAGLVTLFYKKKYLRL